MCIVVVLDAVCIVVVVWVVMFVVMRIDVVWVVVVGQNRETLEGRGALCCGVALLLAVMAEWEIGRVKTVHGMVTQGLRGDALSIHTLILIHSTLPSPAEHFILASRTLSHSITHKLLQYALVSHAVVVVVVATAVVVGVSTLVVNYVVVAVLVVYILICVAVVVFIQT